MTSTEESAPPPKKLTEQEAKESLSPDWTEEKKKGELIFTPKRLGDISEGMFKTLKGFCARAVGVNIPLIFTVLVHLVVPKIALTAFRNCKMVDEKSEISTLNTPSMKYIKTVMIKLFNIGTFTTFIKFVMNLPEADFKKLLANAPGFTVTPRDDAEKKIIDDGNAEFNDNYGESDNDEEEEEEDDDDDEEEVTNKKKTSASKAGKTPSSKAGTQSKKKTEKKSKQTQQQEEDSEDDMDPVANDDDTPGRDRIIEINKNDIIAFGPAFLENGTGDDTLEPPVLVDVEAQFPNVNFTDPPQPQRFTSFVALFAYCRAALIVMFLPGGFSVHQLQPDAVLRYEKFILDFCLPKILGDRYDPIMVPIQIYANEQKAKRAEAAGQQIPDDFTSEVRSFTFGVEPLIAGILAIVTATVLATRTFWLSWVKGIYMSDKPTAVDGTNNANSNLSLSNATTRANTLITVQEWTAKFYGTSKVGFYVVPNGDFDLLRRAVIKCYSVHDPNHANTNTRIHQLTRAVSSSLKVDINISRAFAELVNVYYALFEIRKVLMDKCKYTETQNWLGQFAAAFSIATLQDPALFRENLYDLRELRGLLHLMLAFTENVLSYRDLDDDSDIQSAVANMQNVLKQTSVCLDALFFGTGRSNNRAHLISLLKNRTGESSMLETTGGVKDHLYLLAMKGHHLLKKAGQFTFLEMEIKSEKEGLISLFVDYIITVKHNEMYVPSKKGTPVEEDRAVNTSNNNRNNKSNKSGHNNNSTSSFTLETNNRDQGGRTGIARTQRDEEINIDTLTYSKKCPFHLVHKNHDSCVDHTGANCPFAADRIVSVRRRDPRSKKYKWVTDCNLTREARAKAPALPRWSDEQIRARSHEILQSLSDRRGAPGNRGNNNRNQNNNNNTNNGDDVPPRYIPPQQQQAPPPPPAQPAQQQNNQNQQQQINQNQQQP